MSEKKRRFRSSLGALRTIQFIAILVVIGGIANVLFLARNLQNAISLGRALQDVQVAEYQLLTMQIIERSYLLFDAEEYDSLEQEFDIQAQDLNDTINLLGTSFPDTADQLEDYGVEIVNDFEARVAGENDVNTLASTLLREQDIDVTVESIADDFLLAFNEAIEMGLKARILATQVGLIILASFPLLALAAFISISKVTLPILQLSNAASAIGGNHYHSGVLKDSLKRRNSIGELARAVDQLAVTLAEREAALQAEADAIEIKISETRDRRLREAQTMGTEAD